MSRAPLYIISLLTLNLVEFAGLIGAEPVALNQSATNSSLIDLPAVLRLAGAQNLDVQIARERLNEARANHSSAVEQFFPWISPGVSYRRRDGMAQAVPAGTVSETHLESYAPGVTLTAQLTLGDAIYQSLAAKQLVNASNQALEAQVQESILVAVQAYFDLVKATATAEVLKDAINISELYQNQLHQAVGAGIAFKGDELRVQTQTLNYQIGLRQTVELQRKESARLAQTLHLDPAIELLPRGADLLPIQIIATNAALDHLVQLAIESRPELKQNRALIQAAQDTKKGAVYGPLIPSLGAQVFAGGLGGGHDDGPGNFGHSEDYLFSLGWRFGPGGLFDAGRINATKARLEVAQLTDTKLRDAIVTQVVSGHNRVQSLFEQIAFAERKLTAANETMRLTRERKQFGVGLVLEDIQAQQEYAKARSDYLSAVAEFNKAQYELSRAIGMASAREGSMTGESPPKNANSNPP